MDSILENKFANIRRWKLGSKAAVHKPLLILYVLSQYKKAHERLFSFEHEIYDQLRSLLDLCGNKVATQHPEYPFWRLQNDGFWEVKIRGNVLLTSSGDASKSQLFKCDAKGGFKLKFYERLSGKNDLLDLLSLSVIKAHFPEYIHKSIIQYFEIGQTPVENSINEANPTQYNLGALLEELIDEFQLD